MNERELKERTKKFAHECVKLSMALPKTKLGQHIQGQLVRCTTSVAANYRAACVAQSKKSFIAKLGIVVEEVDVANFWLEFIKDEGMMCDHGLEKLEKESRELTLIFISSRKTAENSIKGPK